MTKLFWQRLISYYRPLNCNPWVNTINRWELESPQLVILIGIYNIKDGAMARQILELENSQVRMSRNRFILREVNHRLGLVSLDRCFVGEGCKRCWLSGSMTVDGLLLIVSSPEPSQFTLEMLLLPRHHPELPLDLLAAWHWVRSPPGITQSWTNFRSKPTEMKPSF